MTAAEHFISLITVASAKKLAALLVACFIFYHGLIHLIYGSDSCKWLLEEGRYKGDKEWQPYGCMMHRYTQTDSRRCLRYRAFMGHKNNFVFVGDTRIHQLYKSFVAQFTIDGKTYSDPIDFSPKVDLNFNDIQLGLKVEFLWRPRVNDDMVNDFKKWMDNDVDDDNVPSMIVAGAAAHDILAYNSSDDILYNEYSTEIVKIIQPAEKLNKKGTLFIWMMQDPVIKETLPPHLTNIDNSQINICNRVANEILSHNGVHIWESSRLIGEGVLEQSPDGYLASPHSIRHKIQILLNSHCNDYMNFGDGTCCSSPEAATTLQLFTLVTLIIFISIGLCICLYRKIFNRYDFFYTRITESNNNPQEIGGNEEDEQEQEEEGQQENTNLQILQNNNNNNDGDDDEEAQQLPIQSSQNFNTLITSIAIFSAILSYFYLCDRTNFFMKENKYYSEFSFWLPLGYILALGLFFTEDCERGPRALNREQTDEWRGLMQAVVLIYHVTGAKNVLPIYMHIRLINSAYLFLSGYGHFCYFWQTGDVSLIRFARVLFRLNLLTVCLCFSMNRPYQFYHFVPLVSFWFLIVFILAWLPPRVYSGSIVEYGSARALLYLSLKLLSLVFIITIFYMSEVFFEKVFVTRPWKALFVTTDDDISEWWSRWRVDRYSVTYGVAFGAGLLILQRIDHIPGSILAPFFAIISLAAYTIFTLICVSAAECEEIHSYIVFVPIVGYIVLRNSTLALRGKYSVLLAGLGRISLETIVSQGHVWLAADSHGVLVLLPRFPVLNLLVSSFIFICASHEIHRLTTVLTAYVVPNDWKLVARNLILFIAFLVPIGIYDGMF
ncbi:hypothetical protein HCN44_006461 [Aphidius gifuensis]|uniref:Cas1p 10 TM acyl transferase domain-containing protein n=1 Tax=Aphidius gifuensis TaxID=684658 RepID=A0A835CST9_APHGI|nr:N-acetylneuraminate 9-O-acetyltransferase [Aphidius gifuensis]KAF7995354.1 hypothetical protein HCN44_006461 [Aphidius gifuensis]